MPAHTWQSAESSKKGALAGDRGLGHLTPGVAHGHRMMRCASRSRRARRQTNGSIPVHGCRLEPSDTIGRNPTQSNGASPMLSGHCWIPGARMQRQISLGVRQKEVFSGDGWQVRGAATPTGTALPPRFPPSPLSAPPMALGVAGGVRNGLSTGAGPPPPFLTVSKLQFCGVAGACPRSSRFC
jgi:hypothetical protein